MERIHVECPVCEFARLKGAPEEGYRCVKCNAHFSTGFVRKVRRRQFSQLVDEHFAQETTIIPEEEAEPSLVQEMTHTIEPQNLDDFLDLSHLLEEDESPMSHVAHEMHTMIDRNKEAVSYDLSDVKATKKTTRRPR